MAIDVRPCSSLDELRRTIDVIGHFFAQVNDAESVERFAAWHPPERALAAWEGDAIVGGAGSYLFGVSVPGGASVPAAGVTIVAVRPTHRRRGILTELMRAQLAGCRERGEHIAYLWASESAIYPRFGYGLAARAGSMRLAREQTGFAQVFTPRGVLRLVDLDEALEVFPPLYEQAFAQQPGMVTRTRAWWETRRLGAASTRPGPPKNFVLLELDGTPAGYAVYTVEQSWDPAGFSTGAMTVAEAVAPTPDAARELWRWLLDFDWTSEIRADLLPLDHPLFQLLAEPRRLRFTLTDAMWVRLVDVGAALAARSYDGDGEIVLEVTDPFLPENAGRWRIGAGAVERSDTEPDLALDVSGLGSVYLGGFTFADLVRGSRARELRPGAAARADRLFRTDAQPWCPEIF